MPDPNETAARPLIESDWPMGKSGGSAAINSLAFWTCPLCAACVADDNSVPYEYSHRAIHAEWHEFKLERIVPDE